MIKPVFETLESRVLLSGVGGETASVVDVRWNGTTHRAFQNEYVALVKDQRTFGQIAARHHWLIEDVRALGGGFFKFSTSIPAKQVQGWAKGSDRVSILPNYTGTFQNVPDDPKFGNQWHLQNTGQFEPDPTISAGTSAPYANAVGTAGDDVNATKAWDITTGSESVVVAVLDSGIDLTHPDLIDNLYTNIGETAGDGIDNDANGLIDDVHGFNFADENGDATDLYGHGTHVAGIIGARGNNSIGVSGINQRVSILPIKVGNSFFSTSAVIEGIYYTVDLKRQGVNIVALNGSFGGPDFPFNTAFSNAIKAAGDTGILFVVSAGNSSSNVDRSLAFPAKFSLSNPNVITVAAVDNNYNLATFSSFGGASVQVAAPGTDILSTMPTYPVTLTSDTDENGFFVIPATSATYGYLSGTSMAAPVVAGILALEAAANPKASMLQLKDALLRSVDSVSSLGSINSLPKVVSQVGVVDAYKAVRAIVNRPVGENSTLAGNWHGAFGSQGAYIVGESTSFPSFVDGRITGNSTQVDPNLSTKKAQALQRIDNPNDRIVAYLAGPTTLTIDLNFTDGLTHRVSVYLADYDNKGRVENVSLIDADTGSVLDTRQVSKFTKGRYLTWDVTGHVNIQMTPVKGPNAIFSGIFFDAAPTQGTMFTGADTTTRGQWTNKYGSQGAYVIGESTAFPAFVTASATGKTDVFVKSGTHDASAPQLVADRSRGIISYWSSATSFDVDLAFTDGQTHRTSLYFYDYKNKKRQQRVDVYDSTGATLLSSVDISNFKKGQYVTFDLSDSVKIRVSNLSGPDALLNGLFFDGAPTSPAQFLGIDTTTKGSWRNTGYGTAAQFLAGYQTLDAFNVSQSVVTLTNVSFPITSELLKLHTTNKTALQYPTDATDRISAHLAGQLTFTLDLQFNDARTHRLALYAADSTGKRQERVEVIDPDTGEILSSTRLTSFKAGKSIVWQVRGHVQIRVTTETIQNAVLDGLFFD